MLKKLLNLKLGKPKSEEMYYAVRKGRNTGIYKSWSECENEVKGYGGARFKKFRSRQEALDFMGAEDPPRSYQSYNRKSWKSNSSASRYSPYTSAAYDQPSWNQPSSSGPSNREVVYTDGGCFNNGYKGARAGVGVFWGTSDSRNVSESLPGKQTNQRAELNAAITALQTAANSGMREVELRTDSMYTINCATSWIKTWKKNGWVSAAKTPVKNVDDIKKLDELCNKVDVKWTHVRGHQGEFGNEQADRLSRQGAEKH